MPGIGSRSIFVCGCRQLNETQAAAAGWEPAVHLDRQDAGSATGLATQRLADASEMDHIVSRPIRHFRINRDRQLAEFLGGRTIVQ